MPAIEVEFHPVILTCSTKCPLRAQPDIHLTNWTCPLFVSSVPFSVSHLVPSHIPRRKSERSNSELKVFRDLCWPAADSLVFRDHDPASLTDDRQPSFVLGILCEVIEVNLDKDAGLLQRTGDYCRAHVVIEEEYKPARRLRG